MSQSIIHEPEIPFLIAENLHKQTGIPITFESSMAGAIIDGRLMVGNESPLIVEMRGKIQDSRMKKLVHQLSERRSSLPDSEKNVPWVLLTTYLTATQRSFLRKNQLYYADLAGNAYIEGKDKFIFIEGKSPKDLPEIEKDGFFTPAFMRLVFALIIQPDLLQSSPEEMARLSGVSRATIKIHLPKLSENGYTKQGSNGKLIWQRLPDLALKWIDSYPTILRPRLLISQARFSKPESYTKWEQVWEGQENMQWGGEPAASLLTHHLTPGHFSLYSRLSKAETFKSLRLIPDSEGPISLLQTFWPKELVSHFSPRYVPPFLICADLIASKDSRNRSIAQYIYEDSLDYLIPKSKAGLFLIRV